MFGARPRGNVLHVGCFFVYKKMHPKPNFFRYEYTFSNFDNKAYIFFLSFSFCAFRFEIIVRASG